MSLQRRRLSEACWIQKAVWKTRLKGEAASFIVVCQGLGGAIAAVLLSVAGRDVVDSEEYVRRVLKKAQACSVFQEQRAI